MDGMRPSDRKYETLTSSTINHMYQHTQITGLKCIHKFTPSYIFRREIVIFRDLSTKEYITPVQ